MNHNSTNSIAISSIGLFKYYYKNYYILKSCYLDSISDFTFCITNFSVIIILCELNRN